MEKAETLETTFGDLVVALTEEATQLVRDEKDAHKVVAFVLMNLFNKSGSRRLEVWH